MGGHACRHLHPTSTPHVPVAPRRGMGCWGAVGLCLQCRSPGEGTSRLGKASTYHAVARPRVASTQVGHRCGRGATEKYGGAGQTPMVPAQGAGCWDAGLAGTVSKVLMVNGGQGRRQGCARGCGAVSQPRQVPQRGCPWPMPYVRLWRGNPVPVPGSHGPTEGQFWDPAADFTSRCP